jgi:putative endonuclease
LAREDGRQADHIALGREGEEVAARYLEGLGYRILEMRYRFGHKEVDIIARDRMTLVFVEVKCRRKSIDIPPYLSVDRRKQYQILKVARAYLSSHPLPEGSDVRFDVVSIVARSGERPGIEHIVDAFRAV